MNTAQKAFQLLIKIVLIGCVLFINTTYPQAKHPYASDQPMPLPQKFGGYYRITFTPDGNSFYYVAGDSIQRMEMIYASHFKNGKWSKPEQTPFSGKYRIETPRISPDGKKFFFTQSMSKVNWDVADLWVMDKTESGWSEPKRLDEPVNSPFFEAFPCPTANGNLYFISLRNGRSQIYRSRFINGKYTETEALDYIINKFGPGDVFIAPDESYILFPADISLNSSQLFISFNKNGSWTEPVTLGPKINFTESQYSPCLSPDGNYLFYNTALGTYQVDFKPILDSLKNNIEVEVHAVIKKDKIIEAQTSIMLNGKNAKVKFEKTPSWLKPYVKITGNEQQVMNKINIEGLKEGVYKAQVKFNSDDNPSKIYSYSVTLKLFEMRPSLHVNNLQKGIKYEYYEDTAFTKIPDFTKMKPRKTGFTNKLDLSVRSRDTVYAINFNGYINIPKSAVYNFFLSSDDGSKLYIDDKLCIDNDGLHGTIGKFEEYCLEKGFHKIKVEYIQGTLGANLDLSYESKEAGIKGKALSNDELYY